MLSINTYSDIYKKLKRIIPDLDEHLETRTAYGKSVSSGFMDLHLDYVKDEGDGRHIIALSHLYKENGDSVPDPDMQIRVIPSMQAAEAMTYQDRFVFQEVYEQHEGKEYLRPKLKEDLNVFLRQLLTNCIDQGHRIEIAGQEKEHDAPEKSPEEQALEDLRKRGPESPDQSITR